MECLFYIDIFRKELLTGCSREVLFLIKGGERVGSRKDK